jgi:GH15 family glucan-1,4-alpha-glucosidase
MQEKFQGEAAQRSPALTDFGLDLAVIGNGRTAALVNPAGRIVWWCFPRFDADPVFCRLLAGDEEKGFTDVVLDGLVDIKSDYIRNTAVLVTILTDDKGNAIRITDLLRVSGCMIVFSGRRSFIARSSP